MQVSIASGSRPCSSSSSTASNSYGKSSRLTTKPGMSGTSTAVLPSASHSFSVQGACLGRRRPPGKDSSTSFIFSTGLNTCRPTKRSARPLARPAPRPTATRWWWRDRVSGEQVASRRRRTSALASWSSTIASTTNVAAAQARTGRSPRGAVLERSRRALAAVLAAGPQHDVVRSAAARAAARRSPRFLRFQAGFRLASRPWLTRQSTSSR